MLIRIALAATANAISVFSLPSQSSEQLETPLHSENGLVMVPEIAAFCITEEHTATTEDFAKAAKKYCHEQSSQGVRIATGDHYTKPMDCNTDRCLTFSLFFKCHDHNNATTHGAMPRHACTEYFRLPWASGEMCVSGGYVGSSVPGACWSALSLATPPETAG